MSRIISFDGRQYIRELSGKAAIDFSIISGDGPVQLSPLFIGLPIQFTSNDSITQVSPANFSLPITIEAYSGNIFQEKPIDIKLDIAFSSLESTIFQESPLNATISFNLMAAATPVFQVSPSSFVLPFDIQAQSAGNHLQQTSPSIISLPISFAPGLGGAQLIQLSPSIFKLPFTLAQKGAASFDSIMILNNDAANILKDDIGQTFTATGAVAYSSNKKEGQGSIHVPEGAFLTSSLSDVNSLGNSDFNLRFWVLPIGDGVSTKISSTPGVIGNIAPTETLVTNKWFLSAGNTTSNTWNLYVGSTSTTTPALSSASNVIYGKWTLIEIDQNYTGTKIYVDTVLESSVTHRLIYDDGSAQTLYVGVGPGNTSFNADFNRITLKSKSANKGSIGTLPTVPVTAQPYIANFTSGSSLGTYAGGSVINLVLGTTSSYSAYTASSILNSISPVTSIFSISGDNFIGTLPSTAPSSSTITTQTTFKLGQTYNVVMSSSPTVMITVDSGALPAGITLQNNIISGMPFDAFAASLNISTPITYRAFNTTTFESTTISAPYIVQSYDNFTSKTTNTLTSLFTMNGSGAARMFTSGSMSVSIRSLMNIT